MPLFASKVATRGVRTAAWKTQEAPGNPGLFPLLAAFCRDLHRKCERQDLNLHGFPHWILSPGIESHKAQAEKELHDDQEAEVPTVVPSFCGTL